MNDEKTTTEIDRNTVKLKKEIKYEDQTYTEVRLDLDSLTGQDMINAEAEARAAGDRTVLLEASKNYQVIIAAKASKVPVELLKKLPAKEFTRITTIVQSFLFD